MTTAVREKYDALVEEAKGVLAQRGEEGKIRIQVGSATCEHAAGSRDVYDEFRRHVEASGRDDIVLRRTGCTGRCSREPIVGVFSPGAIPYKYEAVDRDLVHEIFTKHVQAGEPIFDKLLDAKAHEPLERHFLFCTSDRCGHGRGRELIEDFEKQLAATGANMDRVQVQACNCLGMCKKDEVGQMGYVLCRPSNVLYRIESKDDLKEIIQKHGYDREVVERLAVPEEQLSHRFFDLYGDVAFFSKQSRIALRNCGIVNPEDISEYLRFDGFAGLAKVLEANDRKALLQEVRQSNLRGRGGGGFATGIKWSLVDPESPKPRYIICNADEGDPGAFMDRSMLESDPFSVIEGMIIGAFAIDAEQGFFYIRAEYPLAIRRIQNAIDAAREKGILGKNILGSGFDFDVEIRLGAGAFVCGEETALIHSIEGSRGQPRIRPPYPTVSGLWGKPTVINNVETFANVPVIANYGADWFRRMGTDRSGGTKVFALAGKVCHTGLVEVPMGTTLREVVFDIGGGVAGGKELKAVQTGGPAGGCIPAKFLDTPVDFDTLGELGSIMGSGGMIVLDEDDCMVDVAKFFLTFSQDESCGKCTPCREGTKRMLEILERITAGQGKPDDIDKLQRLASLIKRSSLCGLGRAAPNPILSTIEHFREEYEAHIHEGRCPAKKCTALVHYEIDLAKCVGCTVCARNCPAECIDGERRKPHVIDQSRCVRCGKCFEVCRFDAVKRQ